MEENADDLSFFFGIAAGAKKKGGGAQAIAWLRSLAEFHDVADSDSRTRVLLEIARMSPTDTAVRKELTATLKNRFAGHPALSAVLAKFPLDKAPDPSEVAGRIARWLSFEPNAIYFMPGRGAGRLVEMNPALDVMRLEVGGVKVPLSLVSAEKNLVPLPEATSCAARSRTGPGLAGLAENEPSEALHLLISSFGRALTLQEVKDHFAGVVPEDRWSAFWTAARKNRQVLVSGSSKSASVSWSESADAAEETVKRAFLKAEPAARIDLARKHAKRSKDLAAYFAAALAEDARRIGSARPALAWELSQAALRLAPGEPEAYPAASLLAASDAGRVLGEIRDQGARERALLAVRESRPDWAEIFIDQIGREEDVESPDDPLRRARRPGRRSVAPDPPLAAFGAPRLRLAVRKGPCRRSARVGRPVLRLDRRAPDGRVLGPPGAAQGILRAGGIRGRARPGRGIGRGGPRDAARARPGGRARGAPARDRARSAADEVPGAAGAGP